MFAVLVLATLAPAQAAAERPTLSSVLQSDAGQPLRGATYSKLGKDDFAEYKRP